MGVKQGFEGQPKTQLYDKLYCIPKKCALSKNTIWMNKSCANEIVDKLLRFFWWRLPKIKYVSYKKLYHSKVFKHQISWNQGFYICVYHKYFNFDVIPMKSYKNNNLGKQCFL